MSKKPVQKKKRVALKIILVLLIVIMLALVAARILGVHYIVSSAAGGDGAGSKSVLKSVVDSTELMQYAKSIKADLKDVLSAIKAQDVEAMESGTEKLDTDIAALKSYLSKPIWDIAEKTPGIGKDVASARELVDIAEDATDNMLKPLVAQMKEYPLSALKAEGGFNVKIICSYMDFLEERAPDIEAISERLDSLEFGLLDQSDSLTGSLDSIGSITGLYHNYKDFFPAIRAILGNGEDRLYVFAAQNSAEIRASGGFPGSVGTIQIQDGILTIGQFQSVYQVFNDRTSYKAGITSVEDRMFSERMYLSWDADFCPDFERVAYIWALAYEAKNRTPVDGVISATPVVIQKLLTLSDGITLSDGTQMNGENAAKVLQHDIYFTYLTAEKTQYNYIAASRYADALFAETAGLAMSQFVSSFSFNNLSDFVKIYKECVDERILMIWLADEEEEELIRKAGWSGSLNRDENDPKLGVYFSGTASSKMGWFLDIDTEIGEPVLQEDGSRVYDVTLTFSNVISNDDLKVAGTYILGSHQGGIFGDILLFAPAGGSILELQSSTNRNYIEVEYSGLQVKYVHSETIRAGTPIVVTCKVSTAPGVETPLGLLVTPTLQDYRGE